jgi:hypothetical protein
VRACECVRPCERVNTRPHGLGGVDPGHCTTPCLQADLIVLVGGVTHGCRFSNITAIFDAVEHQYVHCSTNHQRACGAFARTRTLPVFHGPIVGPLPFMSAVQPPSLHSSLGGGTRQQQLQAAFGFSVVRAEPARAKTLSKSASVATGVALPPAARLTAAPQVRAVPTHCGAHCTRRTVSRPSFTGAYRMRHGLHRASATAPPRCAYSVARRNSRKMRPM